MVVANVLPATKMFNFLFANLKEDKLNESEYIELTQREYITKSYSQDMFYSFVFLLCVFSKTECA